MERVKVRQVLNRNEKVFLGIFSFLFAIGVVLTKVVYPAAGNREYFLQNGLDIVSFQNILLFVIAVAATFLGVTSLYRWIRASAPGIQKKTTAEPKKVFFLSFFFNMLFWGICYLQYFPGAGMNDTIVCMTGFLAASLQPVVFQIVVYCGMKFFTFVLGNATLAFGAMVFIQMLLASAIVARFIAWLAKKHFNKIVLWIAGAYFCCIPLIADYTLTFLKDTWFSYAMLFLLPTLYDILCETTNKKWALFLKLFLASLVMMVSRSNGLFIVVPLCIVLLFVSRSKKVSIAVTLVAVLLVNQCLGMVWESNGKSEISFREAMSVPMVQIGAVLNTGGELSEKDQQVINRILPQEAWRENYRLSFVDPIKFDPRFDNEYLNENKVEFLKTWFSILTKNFDTYVKAYLCHTAGFWDLDFWNINDTDFTQSIFVKVNNNTSDDSVWETYLETIGLRNASLFPESVSNKVDGLYQSAFRLNLRLSMGIMVWINVLCLAFLLASKKWQSALVILPNALTWISMMLASPSSMIYRYGFFLLLTLPAVLLLTYVEINQPNNFSQ